MTVYNFKELETNGYILLKNAFNSIELETLKQDYFNVKANSKKPDSSIKTAHKIYNTVSAPEHSLESKLLIILEKIRQDTNIKTDLVDTTSLYFDTNVLSYGWHQDHESYFQWQDMYNHLNFWIPLEKLNAEDDGWEVIGFNTLNEVFPEIAKNFVLHKGAQLFNPIFAKGFRTRIINNDTATDHLLTENIFSCATKINIEVGDILIMRGDLIHRSQSIKHHRVSLSIRCNYSKGLVSKDKFLAGGNKKKIYMIGNPESYKKHFTKFNAEPNRDLFTVEEIQQVKVLTTILDLEKELHNSIEKNMENLRDYL
jgi:hypothetical protein